MARARRASPAVGAALPISMPRADRLFNKMSIENALGYTRDVPLGQYIAAYLDYRGVMRKPENHELSRARSVRHNGAAGVFGRVWTYVPKARANR